MKLSTYLVLLISFLISILLMIAPVAPWLSDIWPLWTLPVLAYWIMALPHRVGLGVAWLSGFVIDISYNSLLGAHALSFLIFAVLFSKMARRFSFFSSFQQVLAMMLFSLIYLSVFALTQYYADQPVAINFWWPAVTTGLIWPLVSLVLRTYRQRFRMT